MYTVHNFRTKKELKQALERGDQLTVFQPGPFGQGPLTGDATVTLEGPHYPEAHKWYASAVIRNGYIIKVT